MRTNANKTELQHLIPKDDSSRVSEEQPRTVPSLEQATYTRCDNLMNDVAKIPPGQVQKRAPKLVELAGQLEFCRSDKPKAVRRTENAHRAAALAGKLLLPREVKGRIDNRVVVVPVGTLLPTQRDLGSRYATPQKKYFDFLMSSLSRTNKSEAGSSKTRFNSLTFKRTRLHVATPNDAEIARRKAYVPVWKEMFRQASHLKPERQAKLLDGFKECFSDLRATNQLELDKGYGSNKSRLVQAFGDSFTHLVEALPDLKDPEHPDTISIRQTEAMNLLTDLRVEMNTNQRTAVANALDLVANTDTVKNHELLYIELERVRRHMLSE